MGNLTTLCVYFFSVTGLGRGVRMQSCMRLPAYGARHRARSEHTVRRASPDPSGWFLRHKAYLRRTASAFLVLAWL